MGHVKIDLKEWRVVKTTLGAAMNEAPSGEECYAMLDGNGDMIKVHAVQTANGVSFEVCGIEEETCDEKWLEGYYHASRPLYKLYEN